MRNMNPVIQFESCFATKIAAAKAAGLTREMLRLHRNRGYVTTRDLAVRMEKACGRAVSATQLLALDKPQHKAAA
jgi:hypothetical protein